MNLVDYALHLAIRYHHGHVNQHDGEPYMLHLHRVQIAVKDRTPGVIAQAAAWLHDSIEDTELTVEALASDPMIPQELLAAIMALTHNKNEKYEDYCYRAAANSIARIVKQCDLMDNFRRNHLIEDEATRLRMAKKYSKGMDILNKLD